MASNCEAVEEQSDQKSPCSGNVKQVGNMTKKRGREAGIKPPRVRKYRRPKQPVKTPLSASLPELASGNENIPTGSSQDSQEAGEEASRGSQASEAEGVGGEPEGKPGRPRKKAKVDHGHVHEVTETDRAWVESLTDSRLDLIVGIKKMALQRLRTCGDEAYAGVLGPRALRLMEIVLEEFISDELRELNRAAPAAEEPRAEDGCGEEVQGPEQEAGEELESQFRADEEPE